MSNTELEIALSARRTKQIDLLPKVKIFLDSIARNSIKSKRSYSSGLGLLQSFLDAEAQLKQSSMKERIDTLQRIDESIENMEVEKTTEGIF